MRKTENIGKNPGRKKPEKMKLGKENCVKEIKHLDVFFFVSYDRDQQNSYSQYYFLSAFCFVHSLIISLQIVLSRVVSRSLIQCGNLLSKTYTNNWLEINSHSTTDFYSHFFCILQQAHEQNSSQDWGIHYLLRIRRRHLSTIICQAHGGLAEKIRSKTLAMQKQIDNVNTGFYKDEIDRVEFLDGLSILVASKK